MAEGRLNILITGGAGQVGTELLATDWPASVVLHAPGRDTLDLTDANSVARTFAASDFAAVINAAAYTAVDDAEDDIVRAYQANAIGPALLASATRRAGIPLLHVSTDYVFDGSRSGAYAEDDAVAPLGIYGASKLAGEVAVRSGNPRSVVLRTAWVFSAHRSNFVKTMIRVGGQNPVVKVVSDQRGCPTSAADIAAALRTIALRMIAEPERPGDLYHFVNAGEASWYDLAAEVFALNTAAPSPNLIGISTAEYPTKTRRPANSVLSTERLTRDFGIHPRLWREALGDVMTQLNQKAST